MDPNDPYEFMSTGQGQLPEHSWAEVKSATAGADSAAGSVNRHRRLKGVGLGTMYGVKAGVTAATFGTTYAGMETGAVAVGGALAAGAAVSATGIGLVAGTAALMIGQAGLAANSLRKTLDHLDELKDIQLNIGKYAGCRPTATAKDSGQYHNFIATKVLPYIIHQKKLKAVKKGVNIVPGGMLLTGTHAAMHLIRKGQGRGLKRSFFANVLGEHLITCDCDLAVAVVTALMGSAHDTSQLMLMDLSRVTPILAPKLKSK